MKTTNSNSANGEDWQSLKEENDKLHTKVHQLEINNTKLKMKISHIEDKLLFFGIGEMEGESEQDRYAVILDVISATFMGSTHDIWIQQAKNVMIESLVR